MRKLIAALASVMAFSAAEAKDAPFTGYGSSIYCKDYLAQATSLDHEYNLFIMGFVTGTNYLRARQVSGDSEAFVEWVSDYCKKNPVDSILRAVMQLDAYLGPGMRSISKNTSTFQP